MSPIEPILDPHRMTIIGAGRLARATAQLISDAHLVVYTRRPHENAEGFPPSTEFCHNIADSIYRARAILLAVPTHALDAVTGELGPHILPDQIVLVASRGVTAGFKLPSEHVRKSTCIRKLGVLGGPLHVQELEAGRRMNAVIASRFSEVVDVVRTYTRQGAVSFQSTDDIIGVQIAGAIANVACIAAGMAEALELGDTARGVLQARGIVEARPIGIRLGANSDTFSGLAGLGELIPRAVTSMERHIELGRCLGRGLNLDAALQRVAGHVEGVQTAREAAQWAKTRQLELPLIRAVQEVLDGNDSPRQQLEQVLAEPLELKR